MPKVWQSFPIRSSQPLAVMLLRRPEPAASEPFCSEAAKTNQFLDQTAISVFVALPRGGS